VRVSFRTAAAACALVALLAVIGIGSAQAMTRHVVSGKPGKTLTPNGQIPKIQGSHAKSADKPVVIFPARDIWRSPAKAGAGKVQTICTQMQIWTSVGTPPSSWRLLASSKNYCLKVKPGTRERLGSWGWQGEVATLYHAEVVITWAVGKKRLAKAIYDYNLASDYTCVTLYCLTDTDPGTHFPYVSFN
jgi:hypothetical protein